MAKLTKNRQMRDSVSLAALALAGALSVPGLILATAPVYAGGGIGGGADYWQPGQETHAPGAEGGVEAGDNGNEGSTSQSTNVNLTSGSGGGGGGAAANGGSGGANGRGDWAGAGGDAGTIPSEDGKDGEDGHNNGGGGGGGGGAHGVQGASVEISAGTSVTGGNGGKGGDTIGGNAGGSGGGGSGGYGAQVDSGGEGINAGTAQGGNGGLGGEAFAGYGNGGSGGDGGAGIGLSDGASVVNKGVGAAIGGDGGEGGVALAAMGGNGGNGGAGVRGGDDVVIVNQDTATVLGGTGNAGGEPASFRDVFNGDGGAGIFVGNGARITNQDNGSITGGTGALSIGSGYPGGAGGAGIGTGATATIVNQGSATITGGVGADAQRLSAAGKGGVGVIASGSLENSATISGGVGGVASSDFTGGVGGAGVEGDTLTINNAGMIWGGNGGAAAPLDQDGGNGGAGVDGTHLTILNTGTISGGDGGGEAILLMGSNSGGFGVTGSDLTVINSGTISGGLSGMTGVRAAAVDFTGGVNRLELRTGYAFNGDIVANGTLDTLALGGTAVDDVLDPAELGAGQRYEDFEQLEKVGAGTWTLEGDGSAFSGQTNVVEGTLLVGGSAGSATTLGGTLDVLSGGRLGGHGTVGTTTNHAGGVIAPGASIGTLTVNGNYIGQGGVLEIETALGDDSSPTDLLVVTGDTSGSTDVTVINRGGTGAATVEGIKIVDVGGASNGTFSLQGDYVMDGEQAVVVGAYGYTLHKNGVSTPDDGDWYLRSGLIDPTDPTGPTGPYQPGAPIYEVYGQVLQGLNGVSTLQQRVGNRYWMGAGNGSVAQGDGPGTVEAEPMPSAGGGAAVDAPMDARGIWARIEGTHGRFKPKTSTSSADYDLDTFKLETGIDGQFYESGAGRLVGGLTVHYGHASVDITSIYGTGSIDTDGYGLGGTLTWYGQNGFYVDGQAKATWYESTLTSDTLRTKLADGNDGFGYAFSAETGKRIDLNQNWTLTPQAQLVYSSVDFDNFTDPFKTGVSLDDGDSLKGRLGLAANYQNAWQDDTGKTRRSHVYGIANLYHEFLGGSTIDVAGVRFASQNDRTWGGIGAGGTLNWADDKYSLYGEVSVNTSLNNFADSYTLNGTAGFRVRF